MRRAGTLITCPQSVLPVRFEIADADTQSTHAGVRTRPTPTTQNSKPNRSKQGSLQTGAAASRAIVAITDSPPMLQKSGVSVRQIDQGCAKTLRAVTRNVNNKYMPWNRSPRHYPGPQKWLTTHPKARRVFHSMSSVLHCLCGLSRLIKPAPSLPPSSPLSPSLPPSRPPELRANV